MLNLLKLLLARLRSLADDEPKFRYRVVEQVWILRAEPLLMVQSLLLIVRQQDLSCLTEESALSRLALVEVLQLLGLVLDISHLMQLTGSTLANVRLSRLVLIVTRLLDLLSLRKNLNLLEACRTVDFDFVHSGKNFIDHVVIVLAILL